MKTNKQLKEEIMEKIAKREEARLRFRKTARRVFAGVVIVGFLLPTAAYYVTNDDFRHAPLSHPFVEDEERPFDSDDDPHDTMEIGKFNNNFELVDSM